MKTIQSEYKNYIEAHMAESAASGTAIKEYIEQSTAHCHGIFIRTLHIPKVFSSEQICAFTHITDITYSILDKIIRAYIKDPAYRILFGFDSDLEDLIRIPNGYDSVLPIARFDIFYNEETGDFKFCEINTDGTSAMNEDYELNRALALNNAHQALLDTYPMQAFELFDSWVDTFLQVYETYEKKCTDKPHVAIVDFLDGGSMSDFNEFKIRFEKAGCICEICDITELTYHNRALYTSTGMRIDAVYRRAVTCDIMEHSRQIEPFLSAIRDQNVCLIGSLCTQVAHNKMLFVLLRHPMTKALLTDDENAFVEAHFPYTGLLDEQYTTPKEICATKDKWILKPLDSYATRGIYVGTDYTDAQWAEIVKIQFGHGHLFQEYYPPYETDNIDFLEPDASFHKYINMTGLYVYNGRFSGIYSRAVSGKIIGGRYGERALPTLQLIK